MAKIKTKARALDMLGRQQIAGIPTALSELFKNAHDAYADNVEVDYIRKKNLLILRDDGLGMTLEEFEQRWLTIGTSSKLIDDDAIEKPPINSRKEFRHIMGEKGIGRLSIAAIGPQVLVLTRALRDGELRPLVVAFVNWSMFTLPSLDLEDIEIPLIEIPNGEVFTKEKLDLMIAQCKDNVNSLSKKISMKHRLEIEHQINKFDFDPEYWKKFLGGMDLTHECGTHFVITPTEDILNDDISQSDHSSSLDQSSRLEKALLGFTNTMYSDSNPPIIARFRDHMQDGQCIDRISESIFFTPQEFNIADHHFEGEFNSFGQFVGKVSIYGEKPVEHIVTWQNNGQLTKCGPFKLKIAYVHGMQRDSRLPPELWVPLKNKTDRYGGLYIYRDGIRILPYGDVDSDFLRIEHRRSRSASEYFFAYRRLFGAIELKKEQNTELQEKAGREGFIENKAFKQFKEILENFFIQTAKDFFLEKGDLSDVFIETKNRYNRNSEILKNHAKHTRAKKEKLKKELYDFFDLIDSDYWNQQISKIRIWKDNAFCRYSPKENNLDEFYNEVTNYLKNNTSSIKKQLDISKPSGVGLTKELAGLWDRFQSEKSKILLELDKIKDEINKELINIESSSNDFISLKRRLEESLILQQERYNKELNEAYLNAKNALKSAQEWANEVIKNRKKDYKFNLDNIKYDLASIVLQNKNADEIYHIKKSIENRIDESSIATLETINNLANQVKTIREGTDEDTISSSKLAETLETELEHLKEQQTDNSELILLGMALSVVHHEFNGNIRAIRSALREFKPWADKNPKLDMIYQKIRASFDHLDGYLKTFTPLTRRLSRSKVSITGSAIIEFLRDVFDDKLEKENIKLLPSPEFLNQEIYTYTSTIFPVFINLIDNAIYWLSKTSGERSLLLNASEYGFIIEDSGPGVSSRDRDLIFEMGFTRKLGGRGMGLFIAKECLSRDGFDIKLSDYQPNKGASFVIEPKITPSSSNENIEREVN